MSRIDRPTLKCDRCGLETQDQTFMGRFKQLHRYHMSGESKWDLCPDCWDYFEEFMEQR